MRIFHRNFFLKGKMFCFSNFFKFDDKSAKQVSNETLQICDFKRLVQKVVVLICCIVSLFLSFQLDFGIVAVADNSSAKDSFQEILGESLGGLDTGDLQKFLDELQQEQRDAVGFSNVKTMLKKLFDGESENWFQNFFKIACESLGTYFLSFLPLFLTILTISILQSVIGGLTSAFKRKATIEIAHFVCYTSIVLILFTAVIGVTEDAVATMTSLKTLSEALFPILLTMLTGLGSLSSFAMMRPLMAIFTSGIMEFINLAIIPLFTASVTFAVVGNISESVKLSKLQKLFVSICKWMLGVVFGLYISFLTAKGIIAGTVDGIGFSVAKFAVSSYVPILGGYLSDGFDLVVATTVLLKNSVGVIGVVFLIAVVFFPMLRLIVFGLVTKLTSALVEPIGDKKVCELLSNVSSSINILIASIAGIGFLFFANLLLTMSVANFGI